MQIVNVDPADRDDILLWCYVMTSREQPRPKVLIERVCITSDCSDIIVNRSAVVFNVVLSSNYLRRRLHHHVILYNVIMSKWNNVGIMAETHWPDVENAKRDRTQPASRMSYFSAFLCGVPACPSFTASLCQRWLNDRVYWICVVAFCLAITVP